MKIALIGYGRMGKEIEKIAQKRSHEIVCIIDKNDQAKFGSTEFKSANVAIEFSTPDTAIDNYLKSFAADVPVVAGTTGWLDDVDELEKAMMSNDKLFFYSSNYSLGVNIFFAVNKYLAKIMDNYSEYDVEMNETHHIHKLDAPSGTAITLAEGILENMGRKDKWSLDKQEKESDLQINAFREGEVPGIHEVIYESESDIISIKHDAKSRIGFALGAVMAAEYTHSEYQNGKRGFLNMKDMLKF